MTNLLPEPTILSKGVYLQLIVKIKFLDDAIIRSNDAEEVLTYNYKDLGNRFIIPWRKIKGKLRRIVSEKQRGLNIYPDCHLKDDLCMECPSCFIFGGTGETSNKNVSYNILSRVLGETFISREPASQVQPYTQNAVGEEDLSTGQALMTIFKVPADTEFVGVVTVKDPTADIASIVVNNLQRLTRIGARSVEWGRVETTILGCKLSDREEYSAYNLVKENKIEELQLTDVSTLGLSVFDTAYTNLNNKISPMLKSLDKKKKDKKEE